MECKSYCKYFKTSSIGAGSISGVVYSGRCTKYGIQTNTNEECLDTLPYHEK